MDLPAAHWLGLGGAPLQPSVFCQRLCAMQPTLCGITCTLIKRFMLLASTMALFTFKLTLLKDVAVRVCFIISTVYQAYDASLNKPQ